MKRLLLFPIGAAALSAFMGQAQVLSIHQHFVTTDLAGTPISSVPVGGSFQLRAYVEDTRAVPQGVFALWCDVAYDASLASIPGAGPGPAPISFVSPYINSPSGDSSVAGVIDEVGSWSDSLNPLGGGQFPHWTVTFQANAPGTLSFLATPADDLPFHDSLLYGLNEPVPSAEVAYGSATLTIVPEPHEYALMAGLALLGFAAWRRRQA